MPHPTRFYGFPEAFLGVMTPDGEMLLREI